MRRGAVGLSADQEIALRRVAYGIVRRSGLRASDVAYLISLDLVAARGTGLVLTPRGQRITADLPAGSLRTEEINDDPYVTAFARALGVKR
jgi:hypothetical protein